MWRGRGGKEKEWIDCIQSDVRVWNSEGLESDGVGDRSMGRGGHGGWAEVYDRVEVRRSKCD